MLNHLKKAIENAPLNNHTARLVVNIIPQSCPFERTIKLGNQTIQIPPLCGINPVSEELFALRFKALCYLEKSHEAQS